MQKMGYPNISIKVYPTYDNYLNEQYYDISNSYMKLNIRENLRGLLTASLIVLDGDNLIKDTTENIFRINITNNSDATTREYILGTTHNDLTILANGQPVRTYNLVPYHNKSPRRFSMKLTNSALDSLQKMIDLLYVDYDMLKPIISDPLHEGEFDGESTYATIVSEENETKNENNIDSYVPSAIWVQTLDKYMKFIADKGISLDNDEFVFCWYEGNSIRLMDFDSIIKQKPLKGLVAEEDLVGNLGSLYGLDIPIFKYEFMTEAGPYTRDFNKNSMYISTSTEKNGSYAQIIGSGENIVPIDRSCIYREMTYANGYEEINRDMTLNQYDVYSKFKAFGDLRLKPGALIEIEDELKLIKNVNIIDEVLQEFSQEFYYSHVHTISNSQDIIEYELDMEINKDGTNYPQRQYDDVNYNNGEVTKRAENPNDVNRKVGLFGDEYNFEDDDGEWTIDEDGNKVEV